MPQAMAMGNMIGASFMVSLAMISYLAQKRLKREGLGGGRLKVASKRIWVPLGSFSRVVLGAWNRHWVERDCRCDRGILRRIILAEQDARRKLLLNMVIWGILSWRDEVGRASRMELEGRDHVIRRVVVMLRVAQSVMLHWIGR